MTVCAVLAAAALAAPSPARAQGLSLAEAVMRALEAGASARIARLETERAEHVHAQARGTYLPQVGVTSEAGYSNRTKDTFFGTDGQGNPQEFSLATIAPDRAWLQVYVSQMLFDLKRWREIEREQIAAEVARIAETRDRDEVAFEVMRRYTRLLELQQRAAAAEEQAIEAAWLDRQAEALYEAGRAIEMNRSLVQLHAEESALEQRTVQQQMLAARADLWIALGEHEPHNVAIELDAASLPRVDARDTEGVAEQVAASPEVRILDLKRKMEEASVSAAKAGRLPTLNFVSGYSNYGPYRYDAYEDEIWVGVDVKVPIFDGLQSSHAIKGAQRGVEIARLRHQAELEKKRARVREIVQQLETGQQRLELAERRVVAAREQQRLADLSLRAERGNLDGALAARERLVALTQEALAARYGQLELWASLHRELGRLADRLVGPQLAQAP